MGAVPEIVEVLAVPGTAPGSLGPRSPLLAPPAGICRVGLALSSGQIAWGDCVAAPRQNPMLPARPFLPANAVNTLQTIVRPALVGQPVDDFLRLADLVDVLTEKSTVTRQVTPPKSESGAARPLTRRELLTGKFAQAQPASPRTVTVPIEQLIHPAIRYGVTQALLAALALAREQSLGQCLAELWGAPAAVGLLGEGGDADTTVLDQLLSLRVAAVGYRVLGVAPMVELGSRLDNWLASVVGAVRNEYWADGAPYRPVIYLAVNGGLGQLHANHPEKTLSEIMGLLAKTEGHDFVLESPFLAGRLSAQIDLLRRLRALCRQRGAPLQLAASAWVNGPADLETLLAADVVDWVRVQPARFGGLQQTVAAMRRCQAAGVKVLLAGAPGETPGSAALLTALALVLKPDLLTGMPALGGANGVVLAQNEMDRLISESGYRQRLSLPDSAATGE